MPPSTEQSDIIRVTGIAPNAERARVGILEKVQQLDDEKQDRQLRNFSVSLNIDPAFHPKIIGM